MDKFVLNIIHRPEMVPEYAEKVTGHGKEEDIARKDLLTESLDIFRFQQETAHKYGLKTTIQMTYASLFNEEAIAIAKEHHEVYGDEIALSLLGLPCKEFRDKYKTKDFCIWMFTMADKISIVNDVFQKFYDTFGFYPESTGSYYMDADLINYIKKQYPSVKCAVATCFEEGPKAYHTCNNSWYTFMDGGPWNPWIPSKQNTHAPAANEDEDSGIVAIPHLSRDLIACYDGNGSNFGTHPQNVLRGMIYRDNQYPYLYNIIDQYRSLEKYNNGYAYNMMFVGPGWLNKMGRWEAPYELLAKSYDDGMAYYGELKKLGELTDMTMAEFADYYREKKTYTEPECALWKDILYGSEKQLFWYLDPFIRVCVNMDQGGALVDLRPYVSKLEWPVGIGTKHITDASYPFLIQEKYRAGYFTHYAGEGTIRSAKLVYKGEEVDLCLCRTKAKFSKEENTRILTLDPVEIEFYDLTVKLQTRYYFEEGSSEIKIERTILSMSDPDAKVDINEYMVCCYGTTEYSEDMTGITLECIGESEKKQISYEYKCREEYLSGATLVSAVVPQIKTKVSVRSSKESATGYIKEGYAFSPMFTLGFQTTLKNKEVYATWLKLEKED
ncbi:hypothetical protein [Lachnoclostridium phytofermentans]|uniref:Uncharacterized protein n=1 Tax=Lachnoclostridium phytofermentans (strain ATCC 700394 / DSM 18823 / ISDg) TaxID=357809 RepID=A9KIS3_LACP7|nr:hypothetical protein [Lachnoclostridium phytofermentans]ABX43936.1 hypothetical protein Cphy_3587 [Lachnoclostridium phytofermentans ISDg]